MGHSELHLGHCRVLLSELAEEVLDEAPDGDDWGSTRESITSSSSPSQTIRPADRPM